MKQSQKKNDPSMLVSRSGKEVKPSGIREFFDIVYSMKDCISLGVGEPDFETPWRISDSGIHSIKDGYTHYTSNRGLAELLELIAQYLHNKYKINYTPDTEILITMGVSQALDLTLRSIIDPGDEIIIIEPCYVSYAANVSMLNGVPVIVPTFFNEQFKVDPERLKKAITGKTKAMLLNYPSNPTGLSYQKELLKQIAEIAVTHNILVIPDEFYSAISYGSPHVSIATFPGMKERTIVLNGFSKSHAMTGWRLGYAAGPQYIIDIMLKIHQYTGLCAPSIAQYAAIEALLHGDRDVERMVQEYTRRRNYIAKSFNDMGLPCLYPEGAFYAFPDVSPTGLTPRDFAMTLLDKEKVAVVPGDAFGDSGKTHIRCSFATSMDNIKLAMEKIKQFIKGL
jgi:aminotransferase